MIVARDACEREVRALLDAEQAVRIARAARERPHGAGAIVVPRKRAVDDPMRAFRTGYCFFVLLMAVPVAILVAFIVADGRIAWPQPFWLALVPALVRSAQAIADLLATRSTEAANPQILPQALDPSLAVVFTALVMTGVFDKVDAMMSSALAWACVYAFAAITVAGLLLRQMRRSREALAWFAAADPATLARPGA
jgi:hypothetical protein